MPTEGEVMRLLSVNDVAAYDLVQTLLKTGRTGRIHRVRKVWERDPSNDYRYASPVLMIRTACNYIFFRPTVRRVDDSIPTCPTCRKVENG